MPRTINEINAALDKFEAEMKDLAETDEPTDELQELIESEYSELIAIRHSIAAVYCDGGLLSPNPSVVGGTYAYFFLDEEGFEVGSGKGFVFPGTQPPAGTPEEEEWFCGLPHVSNNVSELCAAVFALQRLPENFKGTLYSDSGVTIHRLRNQKPKWENVPAALVAAALEERRRHPRLQFVLLDGHPTKKQLAENKGKRGNPVSPWNAKCDDACNALKAAYRGTKNR